MEMTVEMGKGYVLPENQERVKSTIGVIPMGTTFTPVTKSNFVVENTRVGHKTDYERLVIEIWTNGTITPGEALSESAATLDRLIRLFIDFSSWYAGDELVEEPLYGGDMELRAPDVRIEELDFSVRTYNCLKKANVLTIGELIQISEQDLMNIRNFGRKSLNEVKDKLSQLGLSLKKGAEGEVTFGSEDEDAADNEAEEAVLASES
jgi:DNA-directed RNA polymerase subunit alpha